MMSSNAGEEPDAVDATGKEPEPGAESPSPGAVRTTVRRARRAGERAEAEPPAGGDELVYARAQELEEAGQLAQAVELLRELVRRDPGVARARAALGALYERRHEHALALEQFEAARELAPDSVDILLGMASALTELRRYEQAETALRRALRLEPTRADVHGSIGTLSYKRGLYAQAELELKRALELDPGHGAAYFYRGECLNQLGRVDEALEMLERSVQLYPHNARAFFTMGILYDRKHLPQQAAAMYRKAREVAPA